MVGLQLIRPLSGLGITRLQRIVATDVDVETGCPDDHNAGPLDNHPTDFATNLQWYLQLGIYLCQFLGLTDHSWGDSGNLWNFHEFSPEKSYKATP